jgi:hypothetical protein
MREYRRSGTKDGLGMWAVLAGGFTSMMVILALLLTGAVVAGTSALRCSPAGPRCWPQARPDSSPRHDVPAR